MQEKQTKLCIAFDVTTQEELLNPIEKVSPHICIAKLHIDILNNSCDRLYLPRKTFRKSKFALLNSRSEVRQQTR